MYWRFTGVGKRFPIHLSRLRHRLVAHAAVSVAVCCVLAAAVLFVTSSQRNNEIQAMRADITDRLATLRTSLEAELNANVFLANGLAAHIAAVDRTNLVELSTALRSLHRLGRHVRNIGVAPDNRITIVYPRRGNEAAIGLYYPDIPEQWPAVQRVIETGDTVLAGPVELRQGGNGLISRTPVLMEDGTYWGLISLVLDSDSLFQSVGLVPQAGGVRFALRGRDGTGDEGPMIMGDADVFQDDPVRFSVAVPGGEWVVAAYPIDGWAPAGSLVNGLKLLALALCIGVSALVFAFLRDRLRVDVSEQRARAFLETTLDGVIIINNCGIIQNFNGGAAEMLGYQADEVVGMSVNQLMYEEDAAEHDHYIRNSELGTTKKMADLREIRARRKDGSAVPIEVRISNTMISGEIMHIGIMRDITNRKIMEKKLERQASTDHLTGLHNRRSFLENAQREFSLAKRHNRSLVLLLIDADNFKKINDSCGHRAGDLVLKSISEILQNLMRGTDIVGRIGGEEFVVLLSEVDIGSAKLVARRILDHIRSARVDVELDQPISYTVSIGGTALTSEVEKLEDLMHEADMALYAAKAEGKDRFVLRQNTAIQADGVRPLIASSR